MKDYQKVIEKMNTIINHYHRADMTDGLALNTYLKDLSSALYYMETVRANVHDNWQRCVKELISQGNSVSRSENEAHVKYPEMYMLRRVLDSAYEVVGALRTNISYLKNEKNLN